ncbi:MAG: oxidoreductase, partial [Saprospiraceae bacterium]|nr:oxidoreductase [Saprospiraceae bacterium]
MPWKWYDSQVVNIVDLSPNTKSFWLQIDDIDSLDYTPGQFITLDLPIGEKRINRWRSYSIANLPKQDGLIELCIVHFDGGLASEYLFDKVN